MQQVLFHFPFLGLPLYGFGAMLLLSFFIVVTWGRWRSPRVGLPWDRFQDLCMLLLACGLGGARVVYMMQYSDKYPDKSPVGLFLAFIRIWDGGIVFYGSIFGGILGYYFFRRYVLKPLHVNGWKLADCVAPMLAIGMAVGRIGCYLNGCCWGQVACEECQPVPLGAELGKFPLLTAHAKEQVVWPAIDRSRLPQICGLQTTTGFSIAPRAEFTRDARTVVLAVEPNSAAAWAGLQSGDRIVAVNGELNQNVLEVGAEAGVRSKVLEFADINGLKWEAFIPLGGTPMLLGVCDTPEVATMAKARLAPLHGEILVRHQDRFERIIQQWPRGESRVSLIVERNGQEVPVSFTPRTVTFFPTQVYETISMILLTLLLLAYQPFRRHDGQLIVILMLCYAMHRFLNESIRIEPTYRFGLTLSQWISICIFSAGVGLELYLRITQPKLPPGLVPLGGDGK